MIIHGLCISLSDKRCRGLHLYLRMEEYGSKGSLPDVSHRRIRKLVDMLTTLSDTDALEPYCSVYVGNKIAGHTTILHPRPWLKDALVKEGLVFYGCPYERVSETSKQLGSLRLNETVDDGDRNLWLGGDKQEIGKTSKRLGRAPDDLEAYIPKLTTLLRKSDLRLSLPNYWSYEQTLYRGPSNGSWYSRVMPVSDMFYRVFNDRDGDGGRIFGHHYQHLKSGLRQYLTMGGEKTIEIDYASCQPCLAYSLLNLERPCDDLYDIGDPYGPNDRALLKNVFLIGVGSGANGRPAKALRVNEKKDRQKTRSNKPIISYEEAKAVDAAFWAYHSSIAEFRCSEAWRRLQFLESQISLKVIASLADQGIAVLPIFDGFRVAERHGPALDQAMRDAVACLSCPPVPVKKC